MRELPVISVNIDKATAVPSYNCEKCTGYCCTYDEIDVTEKDIARLAKHFGLTAGQAKRRYTRRAEEGRLMKMEKDVIYDKRCIFLDPTTRKCTVYKARPSLCRKYPEEKWCGYFVYLEWEREHQDDENYVP